MDNLVKEHISKFGIEPYIIGMFWSSPKIVADNIAKAIKDNKPYNEYEMITKAEKKDFDDGDLLF